MKLLGLCGSLRRASSNLRLLELAAEAEPALALWIKLGDLPHFNPDDAEPPPDAVREFREQVATADAVLISTPEYAYSLPGVLKNAIDWLVGSGELYQKCVGVLAGGVGCAQAMQQVLGAVDARVPEGGVVVVRPGQQPIGEGHREQVVQWVRAVAASVRAEGDAARLSDP